MAFRIAIRFKCVLPVVETIRYSFSAYMGGIYQRLYRHPLVERHLCEHLRIRQVLT